MTLDIGNDVLMCKVFSASLHDPDSLMVPLFPAKFFEHVPRYLGSLCGPLPMFCFLKMEHRQLIEYQAPEERVAQRLHEAVRASSTPSGMLQYGCHPRDL